LRIDLVLQRCHLVRSLFRIVGGDLVIAIEDGLLLGHTLHRIAEHVLRGVKLGLLWQVTDFDAIGGTRLADEIVDNAGHDFEQRRFAGTVQADDADFGAGQKRERDVLQHLLSTRVGLGKLVHMINILMCGHLRRLMGSKFQELAGF